MTRTVLALMCALCALGAAAPAWSEGGREGAGAGSQPATVRYSFWGNPDALGVEQDIINAYQKDNPGTKVDVVVSGYNDYHTKLLTMIAGGSAPDVMRVDSYYFGDFMQVKALKDLTDLVKRDGINLDAYYQQGIEENTFNGRLYGLPWGTAPLYMFFNLNVLDQAGVKLPPLDWTLDDFIRIIKATTKGQGEQKVYGFGMLTNQINQILPFVWANGGDLFDPARKTFTLDRPEAVQAIQTLADYYKQGYLPPDTMSATADSMTRYFVNNKMAMRMGSAAEILSTQKVEGARFEVWPMPTGKSRNATVFKSNIIGLAANTKQVEPAWAFLKFLRGPSGQGETLYMQAKRMPPTIDDAKYWALYSDPAKYPRLVEQNTKEIAKSYGHKLPLRAGWLEVEQVVMPAVQTILTGQVTAAQAMKDLAPKVQAILDRTGK